MKIWLLKHDIKGRDVMRGCVVRAETEYIARLWAANNAQDEGKDIWGTCPIEAIGEKAKGERGIVLADIYWG